MTLTTISNDDIAARKWLLLLSACLTGMLIPLCFTGPAVVLPSVNEALGGTAVQLNWVINGYILTYGSAMMAAGSLTDIYGRKRVWLCGLALFAFATIAIPFSPTVLWMDVFRLIQGLGGAAAFAGAMSSLAQEYDGHARTRVFSLLGTTFGVGLAFGPLVAGALVDSLGWQWVFLSTAAISILGFIMVAWSARESRDPTATGLDWPGAISFTVALTLFTYAVLLAPEEGWSSAPVLGSLLASAALFAAFIVIERRVARPMLDLSLFREARFVGVQILAASPAFFYVTLIILLPARFIGIEGQTALEAGWLMIALSVPLLVVPFIAATLARWATAGVLSGVGLLITAVGLAWLARALSAGNDSAIILPMATIGTGIGLPWGLMDGLAVSVVEKERAGMATGIFNAVRVSADGVAIAIVGALLAGLIQSGLIDALTVVGTGSAHGSVIEAANRVAMGDLASATAVLPEAGRDLLVRSYDDAFQMQLYILAAASVVTALIVFALLGRVRTHEEDGA
jgi:MFS family permease